MLLLLVGVPLLYGLDQMTSTTTWEKMRPNQIALYLGAIVVVAYVLFVHSLFKLFDDVKWLGQRGAIAEANLLSVMRGPKKLIVSYRFWDDEGRERERDAVIDIIAESSLSELKAGMTVPILYDPAKPEHRNYLWAEAEIYLMERRKSRKAKA
jgi:hypothetical protein